MGKIVTVGSETFNLPTQGTDIGYAEEVVGWQSAVSDALTTVQGVNDIPITTATIANNQTTAQNVVGFLHNDLNTRAFKAEFSIKRTYDTGTSIVTESGTIEGNSDGTDWYITIESIGNSGITLSINSAGQMQYLSTNLTNYVSGDIKFKSKSIDV